MKIKSIILPASALAVMVALLTNINSQDVDKDLSEAELLACVWFPYCNDPESSQPILQPKDHKTEPQDGKDEKLA